MQQLISLYKSTYGRPPLKAETLAKAGSNRQYVRLTSAEGFEPRSVIGVIGTAVEENRTFVYLARHFGAAGLPVPQILAVSDDETRYLQTDLGSLALYDALAHGRQSEEGYSEEEQQLLLKTIRLLPHIQVEGAAGLESDRLLPPERFDAQAAMFDLNYFKYCFLRTTDLPVDEVRLETDFQQLAADLAACGAGHSTFLYRDFQARNVMLVDGEPHFIDFQGGQCGPLQYDVASFLWQASARYPQRLREVLINAYLDELETLQTVDRAEFRLRLMRFVLFRLLQVLGAYGLRGYFERKKYFIDSIPHALASLRRLLFEGVADSYPYLKETLQRLTEMPRFNTPSPDVLRHAAQSRADQVAAQPSGQRSLVVRIFSFSYKKGIPADESGNGGGYVFDCRSTHNPGRYEPYKKLTGMDEPVIRFLEDDGEILTFLDSVYYLADAHCRRYIERGFTDLMFSFGCTGGQHRSVYCAEHLATHLHDKFGIEVRLVHREQGVSRVLEARSAT